MRFRPCIDLHDGKVKQIVGGSLSGETNSARENFVSDRDASWFASLYKKHGLNGGHVILLGRGNEEQARKALAAWPGGLQIGGGVTAENARYWLDAGASHVIVTSYVFHDGIIDYSRLNHLVGIVGRGHLVLDLSCRKTPDGYMIATNLWKNITRERLSEALLRELGRYCDEFLVHAVDVEGMQAGIEEEVLRILSDGTPVPATYAGGIRSLEDIIRIRDIGRGKIDFTIGSALDLFGGALPFQDIASGRYEA